MTVETLIAFGAAAFCLVLLPGPLTSLVARFAVQKGRKTVIGTVPGLALGMTAAMTLAALPLTAVALLLPDALDVLAWLGIAYLMLYALWSFHDPILRRAMAENDNLPERTPLRIFVHFVSACLQTPRYMIVAAALLVQFFDPATALQSALLEMQAAFLVIVAAAASIHAAFPNWSLKTLRRARPVAPASHKFGTRFIARRAVTAGYRRIAA